MIRTNVMYSCMEKSETHIDPKTGEGHVTGCQWLGTPCIDLAVAHAQLKHCKLCGQPTKWHPISRLCDGTKLLEDD